MLQIPDVERIEDPGLRDVMRAVKEQLGVLTGEVGDGSGKAQTRDDLQAVGVVNVDNQNRTFNPNLPGAPGFSTEPLAPGSGGTTPIGGVIPWLKSLTGVDDLPDEWLECNGQVVADELSDLDGTTLPDLNGGVRFLRGAATSGTTGGSATHTLVEAELPAHDHDLALAADDTSGGANSGVLRLGSTNNDTFTGSTDNAGSGDAHNNEPQFYTVVWIIRIK